MAAKPCGRCGAEQIEPGTVQSTGAIYFRPVNARFLTMKTADIRIKANICLECGAIELVGDLEKARQLTQRQEAY